MRVASPIGKCGRAPPPPPGEIAPPAPLDLAQRTPALHRVADGVGAEEDVDGQPASLELVGRPPPCERARRERARGGDEAEACEEWLEARAIGDVQLHAATWPSRPLVE